MATTLKKSLSYVVLRGKPQGTEKGWHDRAYLFWKRFWTQVLRENGTTETVRADEFLRQDRVTCLAFGDRIVAMHAYTFFDLRYLATRDHAYFKRYTEKFFRELERRGVSRVMTMEFFSVEPEWRGSRVGVSLASVLAGLGLKIAREEGVQATISIARTDIGAAKIGHEYGAVSLDTGVNVFNTPCDLVAFFPELIHDHADPVVNDLVSHFWRERVDLTLAAPRKRKSPPRKKAA